MVITLRHDVTHQHNGETTPQHGGDITPHHGGDVAHQRGVVIIIIMLPFKA